MDKASDLKLIADNREILLPAAELAFKENGRGTLLVDTTRLENESYPFQYVRLTALPNDDADCGRMVRTYNPEKEIVVSLFRSDGCVHSYLLGRPGESR